MEGVLVSTSFVLHYLMDREGGLAHLYPIRTVSHGLLVTWTTDCVVGRVEIERIEKDRTDAAIMPSGFIIPDARDIRKLNNKDEDGTYLFINVPTLNEMPDAINKALSHMAGGVGVPWALSYVTNQEYLAVGDETRCISDAVRTFLGDSLEEDNEDPHTEASFGFYL